MIETPKNALADYPEDLRAQITAHLTGQALDVALRSGTEMAAADMKTTTTSAGSRPAVKDVDLAKGAVVLAHCPLDEQRVVTIDGIEVVPTPAPGDAPPPHLVTYSMQLTQGRWMLADVSADSSRTCTSDDA